MKLSLFLIAPIAVLAAAALPALAQTPPTATATLEIPQHKCVARFRSRSVDA